MQRKEKEKRFVLKKWVRMLLLFIICFFACFSVFLISNGLFTKKDLKPLYSYNMKRNIDYKVYLKKNSFFEEEFLEKGKQYTTQLIDYIDIDFSYIFNGSDLADINYYYDIKASIIGEYENTSSGKSELWTKKYTLLDTKSKKLVNSTEFTIQENLKINYEEYNKIVNDFKNNFKLAIDAYLNIKLNIKYDGKVIKNNKLIDDADTLEINIPLSRSTINIETKYDEDNSKNLMPEITNIKDAKKIYAGVVIIIIDLLLFIILFNKIFINKKSLYLKTLHKIMKDYSEIIIESSTNLNYDELEILDIKTFDDMVDIEEELKSPIMVYERIKNKESWFIVVNGNYAYRYILNADNIEK